MWVSNNYRNESQTTNLLIPMAGRTTTTDIMVRLLKAYSNQGHLTVKTIDASEIRKSDIRWADCVLIIRGGDYRLLQIMKSAQRAKRFCVFYLDDDLISLYGEKSPTSKYIRKSISFADVFWASNSNIIAKYAPFLGPTGRAIEEVVLDPWDTQRQYEQEESEIRILFAGSPSHAPLIKKYIMPALDILYRQHKDFRAYFIGFKNTDINGIAPYIETTEWFKSAELYREYVARIKPQIGLAVVEDSEFGRCKFYNKYLEYTKLGVLGIYSNCEPYTFAVRDGINGLLAENTVDGWETAILRAIDSPSLRYECVKNAQRDMNYNYGTDIVLSRITNTIPKLFTYHANSDIVSYHSRLINALWHLRGFIDAIRTQRVKGDEQPHPRKILFHSVGDNTLWYSIRIKEPFSKIILAFARDETVHGVVAVCIYSRQRKLLTKREIHLDEIARNQVTEINLKNDMQEKGGKYYISVNAQRSGEGLFGVFENITLSAVIYRVLIKVRKNIIGRRTIWFRSE